MSHECPVCRRGTAAPYATIADYPYLECGECGSLFIEPPILDRIDAGESLVTYTEGYWNSEISAAKERAFGPALARVAETFLYARRPIRTFLDIGSGPGYLLDACATYLPNSRGIFHGVEKFPPASVTDSPNFHTCSIADLPIRVDAGCCIEVIEHLTPTMLRGLLAELAAVSEPDAAFIFNSGQPSFVKHEDPGYLDPTKRGHIVSYSVPGFAALASSFGFTAQAIPGKTWAFLLEKTDAAVPVGPRIWSPFPENSAVLRDRDMGSVMFILGLESARAYG
jgi:hypothetical protein